MKKLFISQPMSGLTDKEILEVRQNAIKAAIEFSDEVFKEILPRLDRLEGYREDDKLNSLYLRMPIDLEVDGQDVRSVAYWWNNSVGNLIRISPDFSSYNDYITYKQSL